MSSVQGSNARPRTRRYRPELRAFLTLSVVVIATGLVLPAARAAATGDKGGAPCFACGFQGGTAYVGLSKSATSSLPRKGKSTVKKGNKSVHKMVPYEYRTMLACPNNTNPEEDDTGCERTFKTCVGVKDAEGPLKTIFRRLVSPKGQDAWHNVGETCWPKLVPNSKDKPGITVAMIKSEFAKTPLVKPNISIQPAGNRTLVNLATYFAADFSGPGYGPNDVRTVTLLGHKVQIKPVLKSNTFHFGDGANLGPTASRGGTYPDGDVTHIYRKRGSVGASITTVYTAKFAVDNDHFTDLPGTATVTGPIQQLQVLEATDHLVR